MKICIDDGRSMKRKNEALQALSEKIVKCKKVPKENPTYTCVITDSEKAILGNAILAIAEWETVSRYKAIAILSCGFDCNLIKEAMTHYDGVKKVIVYNKDDFNAVMKNLPNSAKVKVMLSKID